MLPTSLADFRAIRQSFSHLDVHLSQDQVEYILEDARNSLGKFSVTCKELIDFLT